MHSSMARRSALLLVTRSRSALGSLPCQAFQAPALVGLRCFADISATKSTEKKTDNYADLPTLVTRLRELFPPAPTIGAPINGDVVAAITETLQNVKLNPREWQQHAVFRRGRYTRSIVGYSPGQFIVLLLCWERGQQSPIHDHAGAHCFIKMLSGRLRERHFAWSPMGSVGPEAPEPGELDAGVVAKSVGFMHDALGLHQIENPSDSEVAVSLHIYSPPFQECQIFPPTGAPPKTAPMVSVFVPEGVQKAAEASTSLSMQDFCKKLSELRNSKDGDSNHLHQVLDLLVSAEMTDLEWASYASPMHFSEFQPVQHIIHCDDEFSVVISCWSPGQKIPPHTVGRGRVMWLKVLHGNLLFQEFSPGLFPWESDVERQTELGEGSSSFLEECGVRMHDLKNLSPNEPAVSIQVFSPPLTSFTFHSEKGTERRDLHFLTGQADATKGSEALSSARALRTAGRWFLSFRGLTSLLTQEFSRAEVTPDAISTLLSKAVFNPQEWRDRLATAMPPGPGARGGSMWPKHILVAQEKQYSVILSFWGNSPERSVAIEGGSGMSWTLVLEGELEERAVNIGADGPQVVRSSVLKEESCSFLSREETSGAAGADIIEHSHSSETPCVSLHVYHPPLPDAWMMG
mmetsp:Transcript_48685/g.87428  ORF Transcript_48685/g.87428 Transcript_48685/m.87428 type:complete len:632 (+) Transcript_48685:16-1911(+)